MRYGRVAVWGWFAFCLVVSGYFFHEGDIFYALSMIAFGIPPVAAFYDQKTAES